MALTILDGALSTHDISLDATSLKCIAARVALQVTAGAFDKTTFCSSRWVEETKGRLQGVGSIVGFASKGTTYSDPLLYVTDADPNALILTADTSCTIGGDVNVLSDGIDLVAAANSGRSIDFRSTGDLSSAWVTT